MLLALSTPHAFTYSVTFTELKLGSNRSTNLPMVSFLMQDQDTVLILNPTTVTTGPSLDTFRNSLNYPSTVFVVLSSLNLSVVAIYYFFFLGGGGGGSCLVLAACYLRVSLVYVT